VLTAKSLCCYLASCWVPERLLVLCNVVIWGHTVKDHHNFMYGPNPTRRSVQRSALRSQEVSPAAPDPEGTGKEAIPDRVSHHVAEARIGRAAPAASSVSWRQPRIECKGTTPQDRSDKPTVRKGRAICRRITIDRHHRHQLHWIRTGRTLSLLAGELSTAALEVYAFPVARTMVFNYRRSATGKSKMGREQVA
jgi:hypothetical protein